MDKLNKISFTNSITTIGENAFSTCSDLAYVDFYGTQEEWNNIVIEDGNNYLINAEITFYEYLPI